ncbi:MAG: radical SAM protein [Gammaproteobacteria bacterium]|nr:radical SAM protein [Gammaproteobacteria bacterium]
MNSISTLYAKPAKNIDVLFIHPGKCRAVYQDLGENLSALEPPVMAALFATYVRRKGMTTDIIDAPVLNLSAVQVAERVLQCYQPKLIAVVVYGFQPSASTQTMTAAGEICRELKARNNAFKIIMTGTHPAALPARTLDEEAVDFVCDREGPRTIYQTALCLGKGNDDYASIPNLWYRKHGKPQCTEPTSLIENLDEAMPIPAWDLLPMEKYRAHNWHCFEHINQRQPYASIYTSLGCPYKCAFCCINAPFGKASYRMWSPQTIVKQVDVLVNDYGVKNIKIADEMFVLNKQHVHGICDLLIGRDYQLNIWAYARIDTVKDEYLDKLRQAGFRWLALGIESGSNHVRDGVEKGRFGTSEIIKTVRRIQDAGINVIGNYIFGLPDDNLETMQETLALAQETNCEFANFYSAMAYPGSKLYDDALAKGQPLPDAWLGFSQHSYNCLPLATTSLSAAQVLQFRDEAFMNYYTNPGYLQSIEKKFGQAVIAHIEKMTNIELEREIY